MSLQKRKVTDTPLEIKDGFFIITPIEKTFPFKTLQNYAYLLIENNEAILFDGGSLVRRKSIIHNIEKLIPPHNISYIVISHTDVDCIGVAAGSKKLSKAKIVTTKDNWALISTVLNKKEVVLLEDINWQLNFHDTTLRFIPTPYLHTPGSFIVYDEKRKILTSFDLFSSTFSPKSNTLFFKPKNIYNLISFLKIYFPNKEVISKALSLISKLDIEYICPHHGYIIEKDHINIVLSEIYKHYYNVIINLSDIDYDKISSIIITSTEIKSRFTKLIETSTEISVNDFIKSLESTIKDVTNCSLISVNLLAISLNRCILINKKETKKFSIGDYKSIITVKMIESSIENDTYIQSDILLSDTKIMGPIIAFRFKLPQITTQTWDVFILNSVESNVVSELKWILNEVYSLTYSTISNLVMKEIALSEIEELKNLALTCRLTKVYNRNYFEQEIPKEIEKAKRYNYPISVIMIDIDNFKNINDTYGHIIGDMVLNEVAGTIKKSIRKVDIPIRYGGEEFLIIAPHTDSKGAYRIAERIRKNIQNNTIRIGEFTINITVSLGVTQLDPKRKFEDTIKIADKALYIAKKEGKNKTVLL